MDDTRWLDATEQAELVRRGEVTPLELVDAAIARIERLNPELNAVVTPMFDLARATARNGAPDGLFRGVPFLLKDSLAAFAGVPMISGSALRARAVPSNDMELVRRYRAAGLIVLGKTNMPEFGILPTTEPRLFGPTRNPWDRTRSPGGSSGGSAAAVAAGMTPMAHGNDGGGSLRIPASCCGLFGLKPTRARTPLAPVFGDLISGLVCSHAITRSVRDSAALLDATAGPAPGDPYWAPPPERPFIEEVGANPGRLRIAFSTRSFTASKVDADCIAATTEATRLCEDLGHAVEEAAPDFSVEMYVSAFRTLWIAGIAAGIERAIEGSGAPLNKDDLEPLSAAMFHQGRETRATEYLQAVSGLQWIARRVAKFFERYDALLTPTLGWPPPPLGTFDGAAENPWRPLERAEEFVPFTPLANATGGPAMSVPLFWNEQGLPVGVHFMGRFGDEATLFRLAAQLEEARPWAGRRPGVIGREGD